MMRKWNQFEIYNVAANSEHENPRLLPVTCIPDYAVIGPADRLLDFRVRMTLEFGIGVCPRIV